MCFFFTTKGKTEDCGDYSDVLLPPTLLPDFGHYQCDFIRSATVVEHDKFEQEKQMACLADQDILHHNRLTHTCLNVGV